MLVGNLVTCRFLKEAELEFFHLQDTNVSRRGPFFPAGPLDLSTLGALKKRFEEDGFWDPLKKFSIMVIENQEGRLVGRVGSSPGLFNALEIGWIIWEEADRKGGLMTEAVRLYVRLLFGGLPINRVEAFTHPDNIASQKLALKCGFTLEATLRGLWYQHGCYHDLNLYRLL